MKNISRGKISLGLCAAFFVFAGCMHFVKPDMYMKIMPSYLPFPEALVQISGVCEILGGLGLLHTKLRKWAGYGLIALLVAVFPANINMAQQSGSYSPTMAILSWVRLPFQAFFIWWVWRSAIK